mmetsp:Transcript_3139/g.7566  ORF Transcript_3139/g.7566 Transcript_3139/m.7566 type:complete len:240 (+) Transcript_3139:265-984(+)
MSTQDDVVQGELPEAELMAAIKAIFKAAGNDMDNVTCKEVLDELARTLHIDRVELKKRHKKQVDQRILRAYGELTPPDQLTPSLYLGTEWNATNLEELRELNIRRVINCTREGDIGGVPSPFGDEGIAYMRIDELDTLDASLIKYWDASHAFIKEAEAEGTAVLVHCQRGVSRSAATCIAHLMRDRGWSKSEAFEHVQKRRGKIKPNDAFLRELDEYQQQLFDAGAVYGAHALGTKKAK